MKFAFFFWASLQSFFFATNIFLIKKSILNRIISIFFVFISLNIILQYIGRFVPDIAFNYPILPPIVDLIEFCYGPLIYLYAENITEKEFSKKSLLHFIPALLFALYFIIVQLILNQPYELFDYILTTSHKIVLGLIATSFITYMIFIYNKFKNLNPSLFKGGSIHSIWWLNIFFVFLILKAVQIIAAVIVYMTVPHESQPLFERTYEVIFLISIIMLLLSSAYMVLKFPHVVNKSVEAFIEEGTKKIRKNAEELNGKLSDILAPIKLNTAPKIANSVANEHMEKLNKIMVEQKIYTNSELKGQDVADLIDIRFHQLSRILNENMGTSLPDYINNYRIEEAQKILSEPKNASLTIFAVAVDSGFKSEAVFYTKFKKITGLTPNQFKIKALGLSAED